MKKLMIVDDEVSNLELFSEIFEDDDIQIECCTSGEEALNKYNQFLPEVIILDIMMPGMDGFDVCQKIKSLIPAPKIIMVSGMAGSEVEQRAKTSGCDQFYLKPVNIFTLHDEVLQES